MFYEIIIQARARGRSPEGELIAMYNYCIKHEDFLCYMYNVFYITTTPYLPCNNNYYINRKELYDFYYTAITLTTGYK